MEELTPTEGHDYQAEENPITQPAEVPQEVIETEAIIAPVEEAEAQWGRNRLNVEPISDAVDRIKDEIHKVVVGQDEMLDLLIVAMLAGGHVILEGVPGIAKTLTAKLLAQTIHTDFSRIQFTPDLMPSDVVGTTVFNMKTSDFTFNKGPIFSNIVLVDEINRAPAKTQSALFEVMEERQVTTDGTTHKMSFPFMVLATQNPIEQEGTYKLPEAQLDRFLFRVLLSYPSLDEEVAILERFKDDFTGKVSADVRPTVTATQLAEYRELIEQVHIRPELLKYIAEIIHNTRNNGDLFLGASPRASLAIMRTAKTKAAMSGRDFVTPDDIRFVVSPVLNHRIILTPEREMEGFTVDDVIGDIVEKIEVPR